MSIQLSVRTTGLVPFSQMKTGIQKGSDVSKITQLDTTKSETKSYIF